MDLKIWSLVWVLIGNLIFIRSMYRKRTEFTISSLVLETTINGIITTDNIGRITSYNKAAERLFGFPREQVINQNYWDVFCQGIKITQEGKFTSLVMAAIETGETFNNKERIYKTEGDERVFLMDCLPFLDSKKGVLGTLCIYRDITERKMIERKLREVNQELESLVVVDSLTRLYNHKYLHERLELELTIVQANKNPLILILMDIDYFKIYNDNFGHQAGDLLLKTMGNIIKDRVTDRGIVARFGADEFAIILPNYKEFKAMELIDEIRRDIANLKLEGKDVLPLGKFSISTGVAVYQDIGLTKDNMINMAADALQKAKNMAKGKVELYFSVLDNLKGILDKSEMELFNTIRTLIYVINAKDKYTFGHSERVVNYSLAIAKELGLTKGEIQQLQIGAYLHDIGKIEIGREILNKLEPLSYDEWQQIKMHSLWGAEIIKPIKSLKGVMPLIKHHHERYDGSGYPDGLREKQIPLGARIIAVADSFDAMTTNRSYQKAKSQHDAFNELKKCAGKQFDPQVVEAFIQTFMEAAVQDVS